MGNPGYPPLNHSFHSPAPGEGGIHTHDNYKQANKAPRCNHLLADSRRCSQPALRLRQFCRFHDTALNATRRCDLAPVDSAQGLQTAIAQIVSAMLEGRMERRTGELCLQGLHLANANLHRLVREQAQLSPRAMRVV